MGIACRCLPMPHMLPPPSGPTWVKARCIGRPLCLAPSLITVSLPFLAAAIPQQRCVSDCLGKPAELQFSRSRRYRKYIAYRYGIRTSSFSATRPGGAAAVAATAADAQGCWLPTMRVSPFLTAIGAGAGTFVTLGAATFLVSGVALSVTKRVVRARKVRCWQQSAGDADAGCDRCKVAGFLLCIGPQRHVAVAASVACGSSSHTGRAHRPACLAALLVLMQLAAASPCSVCEASGFLDCQVCMGACAVHCWPAARPCCPAWPCCLPAPGHPAREV